MTDDDVIPAIDPVPRDAGSGAPSARSRWSRVVVAAATAVLVAALVIGVQLVRGSGRGAADGSSAGPSAPAGSHTSAAASSASAARFAARVTCAGMAGLRAPGLPAHPASRHALAGFRPVAAVQCSSAERRYADGVWSVSLRQVASGSLTRLVTALEKPDEPRPADLMCAAYAQMDPQVVLVDAAGRFLRPRYPRDACDHLQAAATAATQRLDWRTVSVRKLQLDIPDDPVRRTCETAWKDMIVFAAPTARTSAGGPLATPDTTIACTYRVRTDPEVGAYATGARLGPQQARALAAALSGAGRPGACTPPGRFAVVHFGNALAYVELGGCWRVLRPDGTIGHADSSAVERILGG